MEVAICDDNSAYVDILYDYVCKYAYENNSNSKHIIKSSTHSAI